MVITKLAFADLIKSIHDESSNHYGWGFLYTCGTSIPCLILHAHPVNFVMIGGGDSMNNKLYEEVLEAGYKVGKQLDVLKYLTIISYAYFIESVVFFWVVLRQ